MTNNVESKRSSFLKRKLSLSLTNCAPIGWSWRNHKLLTKLSITRMNVFSRNVFFSITPSLSLFLLFLWKCITAFNLWKYWSFINVIITFLIKSLFPQEPSANILVSNSNFWEMVNLKKTFFVINSISHERKHSNFECRLFQKA